MREEGLIMKKEIIYIDLMSPILDCFRVYKQNIENFEIKTHEINLDGTGIIEEVVEEMILIVEDIDDFLNLDNLSSFDEDSSDISAIRVVYADETEKEYLISMTNDYYNRGQMNRLDDCKLYISIKDESKSVLDDID
jgi:hypothetical protein